MNFSFVGFFCRSDLVEYGHNQDQVHSFDFLFSFVNKKRVFMIGLLDCKPEIRSSTIS